MALTIVANITAKTANIEQVKAELMQLVKTTRAQDEGCINYNLHLDNDDSGKFMVYEIWQSEQLLQKHVETEHFKNFMAKTEDLLALFSVNTLTQIA